MFSSSLSVRDLCEEADAEIPWKTIIWGEAGWWDLLQKVVNEGAATFFPATGPGASPEGCRSALGKARENK